eukprot:scaffold2353_cov167-Amphora_coffeaeformis.AAC.73
MSRPLPPVRRLVLQGAIAFLRLPDPIPSNISGGRAGSGRFAYRLADGVRNRCDYLLTPGAWR